METLKKSRFAGPEFFLRFEADLDFSRPGFLEIKVQIKRPSVNWKSELTPHLQYIFVISYIFINLNLALSYRYVVNKKAKKGGRPTSRKLYMLPRGHGWWVFLSLSPTYMYIHKATKKLFRLNIVFRGAIWGLTFICKIECGAAAAARLRVMVV